MDERQHAYSRIAMAGRRASLDIELTGQIIEALMAADTVQELLETITEHGYDGLRPAQAAVATLQEDGRLHLVAGIGVPDAIRASFPMNADEPRPLAQSLADRAPIWIESATDRDRWYPRLTGYADLPRAAGFLPLELAGGVGGVLAVLFDHDRTVSEAERSYWRLMANLFALTLDRLERRTTTER
jgi:hypothetical protein